MTEKDPSKPWWWGLTMKELWELMQQSRERHGLPRRELQLPEHGDTETLYVSMRPNPQPKRKPTGKEEKE